MLSDITPHGVKVPDILLTKRAIFEYKKASSLSSVDSQTKKALLQLDRENLVGLHRGLENKKYLHVLIISIDCDANLIELKSIISHRILRYSIKKVPCLDYVIIKRKGRSLCFMEVQETPINDAKGSSSGGL